MGSEIREFGAGFVEGLGFFSLFVLITVYIYYLVRPFAIMMGKDLSENLIEQIAQDIKETFK